VPGFESNHDTTLAYLASALAKDQGRKQAFTGGVFVPGQCFSLAHMARKNNKCGALDFMLNYNRILIS
jgi:hypothetical protein